MVRILYFISFFIFFFLMINFNLFAQISTDFEFIMVHNPIDSVNHEKSLATTLNYFNEQKTFLKYFIRFYQMFISTQDKDVCNFSPSCSNFAIDSLNKYGTFYGILMTSDRLQRCHGMGRNFYTILPETGKCYDPVEHNFLRLK